MIAFVYILKNAMIIYALFVALLTLQLERLKS